MHSFRRNARYALGRIPLVRSLVTGRRIVDRTNVTTSKASALRMHSDAYFYVLLGYGEIFSDRVYGKPAIGFDHRSELGKFAIDVSFLNAQLDSYNGYSATSSATAASLLKLEGLRVRPGRVCLSRPTPVYRSTR